VSKVNSQNAQTIAELVVQLGRITHGSGYDGGLTPAQWNVLRYFSRANRFSRTVSAFAEFHSTTRGTASQTVKSLLAQGYLSRERSASDGRSAYLDVTDAAKALLARDPCEDLVRAAGTLSAVERNQLATGLERLLSNLVEWSGKRRFGVCTSCTHLEQQGSRRKGMSNFECTLFGEPLQEEELEKICINFRPDEKSGMRRARG